MKLKKIPRYLALRSLTMGASLIIGFLSFSGMFTLWPVLPLAFASFGLSVAYEGEVYFQNIKGAWNKLFKRDHLKYQLANDYLLNNFPDNTLEDTCPQFYRDYEAQLNLLHQFGHKHLDKSSRAQKTQVEKTLRDMEKWFATQLFADKKETTKTAETYAEKLRAWLAENQQVKQDACKAKFGTQYRIFQGVKVFSILSGLFMGLGTTYLLVEALSVIPMFIALPFTTWPLLILPMASIAGIAYGLLTYNAVTDMISNDTLRKWFNSLKNHFTNDGITLQNVFISTTAVLLVALALVLTICTAGTWWTVAKETRPLFTWMGKMPGFVMGVINPLITGLSAVVFNLQNTSESLELIDTAARKKGSFFTRTFESIKRGFNVLLEQENWLQLLNPFRLLLKITLTPLRILLFLGHLISIGVTADRVPGVPQFLSALFGIISEGFEDFHYFVSPEHDHHHHEHDHHGHGDAEHQLHHKKVLRQERLSHNHGHNHDLDLPSQLLKLIFYPVYFLATSWDYFTSKINSDTRKPLSFNTAWKKQTGVEKEEAVTRPKNAPQPSVDWQLEQAVFRIEHYKAKHLQQVSIGSDIAKQKINALTGLQEELRGLIPTDHSKIETTLATAKRNPIYNTHRFFDSGKTETAMFIDELPQRIGLQVDSLGLSPTAL